MALLRLPWHLFSIIKLRQLDGTQQDVPASCFERLIESVFVTVAQQLHACA